MVRWCISQGTTTGNRQQHTHTHHSDFTWAPTKLREFSVYLSQAKIFHRVHLGWGVSQMLWLPYPLVSFPWARNISQLIKLPVLTFDSIVVLRTTHLSAWSPSLSLDCYTIVSKPSFIIKSLCAYSLQSKNMWPPAFWRDGGRISLITKVLVASSCKWSNS